MNDSKLEPKIVSIAQLLSNKNLEIPPYQRPYKWTIKNVIQLLEDIDTFKDKRSYRIGTVVIHEDEKHWNIVDGQQRTITLILLTKAIYKHKLGDIKNIELANQIRKIHDEMINPIFTSEISQKNIFDNFKELERRVINKEESFFNFLYNHCEVTQFILSDISEAFQFFDSQNARGKDLEPHDLLKAYHLRELSPADKKSEAEIVREWEDLETSELTTLFEDFLYRVKGWSKGNSSRHFTKEDVPMFKGINLDTVKDYPFVSLLKGHNKLYSQTGKYPFQLDQTVVNGKYFFDMVGHYKKQYIFLKKNLQNGNHLGLSDIAQEIIETIDNYEGMYRTGDRYVRMLFDCAVLHYLDKFGKEELSYAIEKIFVWAYNLRLSYYSLQMASIDNYVVEGTNLFKLIKDSINPRDVISININLVDEKDILSKEKTTKIQNLLKKLKYYA